MSNLMEGGGESCKILFNVLLGMIAVPRCFNSNSTQTGFPFASFLQQRHKDSTQCQYYCSFYIIICITRHYIDFRVLKDV